MTESVPGRLWGCFQHGPFARYMAGEAVSMTGTWMQVMAQGWVMTTLTTSAVMLGLVNFATGIPMLRIRGMGTVRTVRTHITDHFKTTLMNLGEA